MNKKPKKEKKERVLTPRQEKPAPFPETKDEKLPEVIHKSPEKPKRTYNIKDVKYEELKALQLPKIRTIFEHVIENFLVETIHATQELSHLFKFQLTQPCPTSYKICNNFLAAEPQFLDLFSLATREYKK